MWDEITRSVKASLYDRTTSPLFGAYAVAWCIWNYKLLLTIVAELPIREKLGVLHEMFFPNAESYVYVFGAPLVGALLFIFLYPYPARYVYAFWQTQQKILKEVRKRIDDETPLTKEEERELRHGMQRQEEEYLKIVSSRDAEIRILREQLQALREPLAKNPVSYLMPSQHIESQPPTEYEPTEAQLMLLRLIAESPKSNLSTREIRTSMQQSHTKTDFDIGELMSNGFITIIGSDLTGPMYTATHPGRKILVSRGLVK